MGYKHLGAHVNWTAQDVDLLIETWKPPLVVLLDQSEGWRRVKRSCPNTIFVGRIMLDHQPDFNQPLDVPQYAAEFVATVRPMVERMIDVWDYMQTLNEPVINSVEAAQRLGEFEMIVMSWLHDFTGGRIKPAIFSFGVGHPTDLGAFWPPLLHALEMCKNQGGALAKHQYDWPNLNRDPKWYILRHRLDYGGCPEQGWPGFPEHLADLPLLITECGLDGLIEGGTPRGWRTLYTDPETSIVDPAPYLQELTWFDEQLHQDKQVKGAAVYCFIGGAVWEAYECMPEIGHGLAQEATPIYRTSCT